MILARVKKSPWLLKLSAAVATVATLQGGIAQAAPLPFVSDTGSAVFSPYYTIRDGLRTQVHLTNTSANSLAVKVRLREARNSRSVLEFVVLLSPADEWNVWIEEGDGGRPFLQTTDRSCTVPISVRNNGASASELAYSGTFRDHLDTDGDIGRMSEGSIEILVMGETAGGGTPPSGDGDVVDDESSGDFRGSTAYFAEKVVGEPRDCNLIQNDFVRRGAAWVNSPVNPIPGADGSGSPLARHGSVSTIAFQGQPAGTASAVGYGALVSPAMLAVNVSFASESQGVLGGVESLHIAGWGLGQNLVTAQQFPWFLEPTLASHASLWTTSGLAEINSAIETLPEWVATFPTKHFQTDEDAGNVLASCSVWRNTGSAGGAVTGTVGDVWDGWPLAATRPNRLNDATCPGLGFPEVFQDGNNGSAAVAPLAVTLPEGPQAGEEVSLSVSGNGWVLTEANALATASLGATPLRGVTLPQNVIGMRLRHGVPGTSVNVVLSYPQDLPPGTRYYKYGRTQANPTPHWYEFAGAQIVGNTITLTLVDGGAGDDDITVNGEIVDPGGPGIPTPIAIPTLSQWVTVLLAGMLGLLALGGLRLARVGWRPEPRKRPGKGM